MYPFKLFLRFDLNTWVNAMNGRLYMTFSTHSTLEKEEFFLTFWPFYATLDKELAT
jgi:hypothetical protein